MNSLWPYFFFVSFFGYSREKIIGPILYLSFFLGFVLYDSNYYFLINNLIFWGVNLKFSPKHLLKAYQVRTIINTFFYLGLWIIMFKRFSFSLLIMQGLWNVFLTTVLFQKRNFNFSKK